MMMMIVLGLIAALMTGPSGVTANGAQPSGCVDGVCPGAPYGCPPHTFYYVEDGSCRPGGECAGCIRTSFVDVRIDRHARLAIA